MIDTKELRRIIERAPLGSLAIKKFKTAADELDRLYAILAAQPQAQGAAPAYDPLKDERLDPWQQMEHSTKGFHQDAAPPQDRYEHSYYGAGEKDCPRDIKGANGELHTLQCRYCGEKNPRGSICRPKQPQDAATAGNEPIYLHLSQKLIKSLKRLSFAAQTSGGTAGRDEELIAAIAEAERVVGLASFSDSIDSAQVGGCADHIPDDVIDALERAHVWLQGSDQHRAKYIGEVINKYCPNPHAAARTCSDEHVPAPSEATPAMLDAAVAYALNVSVHGEGGWSKYVAELWRRMYDVAIRAEGEQL